MIAWRSWRVKTVMQFLDDDILVTFEHVSEQWQVVRFTVVNHDNPLYVLKTDGLVAHGVDALFKHIHVHIVERCNN